MIYRDRRDAGKQLATVLKARGLDGAVVLGIPRGGVPVAAEVAQVLNGELGVVVARKLGAPMNPELAIGATTASGATYINLTAAAEVGANESYIEAETHRQVAEAQRREQAFDGIRRPEVKGRIVVVVDDGIATGATAIAAVRSIKKEGAARVVLAIPVGPPDTVRQLRMEADEVICLEETSDFWAVGQFYREFDPVSDEEVRRILDAFSGAPAGSRNVEIVRNNVRLAGVLATPPGTGPFPLVIFVHGLGSSKESPRNRLIAEHLVRTGIATLLFDLSGHGDSSGALREGIESYVADLEAAFAWAEERPEIKRELIGIAGSSLGAAVAVRALLQQKVRPRTMVLRGPPIGQAELQRVHVPSLLLVGSQDPLANGLGPGNNPDLRLSVVEGAGHLFEEPGTLEEALKRTVDWFTSTFSVVAKP
jgi:predicted phosphoribosyltransferase/alpha-beta hydrolase superfamily lysophospholipase